MLIIEYITKHDYVKEQFRVCENFWTISCYQHLIYLIGNMIQETEAKPECKWGGCPSNFACSACCDLGKNCHAGGKCVGWLDLRCSCNCWTCVSLNSIGSYFCCYYYVNLYMIHRLSDIYIYTSEN